MFNRIMYMTVFTSDQDRALEFYTESFGFHERVNYSGPDGRFLTTSSSFAIGTDSTGAIDAWEINLSIQVGSSAKDISTDSNNPDIEDFGSNLVGAGSNRNAGTWVETVNSSAVPKPSTFALLGSGILGLAGIARRKLS